MEIGAKGLNKTETRVVKQLYGGNQSLHMTRSRIFQDKFSFDDRNALVFGTDESAGGVIIYDVKSSRRIQVIKSPTPVLDLDLVKSDHQNMTVATLTEDNLTLYTKRVP